MAKGSVKDIDKGWKHIMKVVPALEGAVVSVGVIQGKSTNENADDSLTAAGLAAVHEFGSEKRNIPERSFLRSTIRENKDRYFEILEKIADNIMVKKKSPKQQLGKLGLLAENDVKKKIVDLKDPPLKAATIARKGSSNPLIDKGHMKDSITHKVELNAR